MPVRARASPKVSSDLVPDVKLEKGKALGSELNLPLHDNATQIHVVLRGGGAIALLWCGILRNDVGMGGQRN